MINHNHWGIKTRVLFVVGLPVFLLTFVLTYYIQYARNNDLDSELKTKAKIISTQLAMALEFAVATNNVEEIKSLTERSMSLSLVKSIRVSDDKGKTLYISGNDNRKNDKSFSYKSNITSLGLEQGSFFSQEDLEQSLNLTLGFVEVFLSQQPYISRQNSIFWTTILIALIGLFISLGFAVFVSRSVTAPIVEIIEFIKQIKSGELDARLKKVAGGEIGLLQENLNHMTATMQKHQQSLELEVKKAVADLNDKLLELEQKNILLKQAEQEALSSKNAKSNFLASMSHEIRTPLNSVIGFSQLLKEEQLSSGQLEYCDAINYASKQLLTVINDILSFSKLESGKMSLQAKEFSFRSCLENTFFLLSQFASEKSIELLLIIDENIPDLVIGDRERLSQIVMNIVNNAIKFTDKGFVVAKIEKLHQQEVYHLKITDTGCGMSESAQEKLFTPFFQENRGTNKRYAGTGLGLIICKQLIELMHGTLSFSSTLNKGSEFIISFPLETTKEYKVTPLSSSLLTLLFDEYKQSLYTHRDYLAQMNLSVDTSSSIEEFTRKLKSHHKNPRYDLLVISLPSAYRMDFFVDDYLSSIREYYDGHIVVLLLGGNTLSTANFESIDSKLSIMGKPIRTESLIKHISILNNKGVNTPPMVNLAPKPKAPYCHSHILVADDSQLNQLYLTMLLEKYKVNISCASTGKDVIELCKGRVFDLILMDLHMPDMDGLAAMESLRSLGDNNAKTPIILVTADIFSNENNTLIEKGFSDVIYKPIDTEKLEAVFSRYLSSSVSSTAQKLSDNKNNEYFLHSFPNELIEKLFKNLYDSYWQLNTLLVEQNVDQNKVKEVTHSLLGLICYFKVPLLDEELRKIQAAIHQSNYPLALSLVVLCMQYTQEMESEWRAVT